VARQKPEWGGLGEEQPSFRQVSGCPIGEKVKPRKKLKGKKRHDKGDDQDTHTVGAGREITSKGTNIYIGKALLVVSN